MAITYEAPGWRDYDMDYARPHREIEPLEQEIAVVGAALDALAGAGILRHTRYDPAAFQAHRDGVRAAFDIPWTAITPRMQRLLYAVNAIAQPQVMVAVGIFCGNTFISNAGAGIGPGAVYRPKRLVGIEIRPEEAARARRNVAALDADGADGAAEIVASDGLPWLQHCDTRIDLLYLDADGAGGRGKSIYLDMLEAAWPKLRTGSLVIAHNSVNCAAQLADYLAFVRDPANLRASANMVVDREGIEVSIR
jgi:predicted O-methyltransferase YrrM